MNKIICKIIGHTNGVSNLIDIIPPVWANKVEKTKWIESINKKCKVCGKKLK